MITFSVPAEELRAILHFASEDETRLNMCAVHFEVSPGRALMVATDGRALGLIRLLGHGAKGEGTVTIPAHFLRMITALTVDHECDMCSCTRKLAVLGPIHFTCGDVIRVEFGGFAFEQRPAEHKFPDWRNAIPRLWGSHPVVVSAWMLEKFILAMKELNPDNQQINFGGGGDNILPYHVTFPGYAEFFGLLMPCRNEGEPKIPDWLREEAK